MKRIALILVFFTTVNVLIAQDNRTFKFSGTITDRSDAKAIDGYMVDVFVGNDIVKNILSEKKGRFKMELDAGNKYIIEINKEGYYTKRAIIDLNIPSKVKKLAEFKFEMELIRLDEFEDLEAIDPFATSIFDFPYVIFEYDDSLGDLNYRQAYTDHIKDQYKSIEDLR